MLGVHSLVPISVLTDSYKISHHLQYPAATKMVAYGEFRAPYERDTTDSRILYYGMRYILQNYLLRQWTLEDIDKADKFFRGHLAPGNQAFPFPKDLFHRFVHENNGYFPIKLQSLPEGSCIHAHVPVFQITTQGPYAPLCTFLEVLLTMVWYPTTVATLSRRTRDVIEAAFDKSADAGKRSPLVGSRLHDFGFRGCSGLEQSVLGGVAHLLSFEGSDTLSACYYAQFELNDGDPVGSSVPATEHSVMTSWPTEQAAIENMIQQFGSGMFACVMDSYDYAAALGKVLPVVAEQKLAAGGYMILRPDSGDPVQAVLMALRAAEKVFGVDTNGKGCKIPRGCGVIQGDGVTYEGLVKILDAVLDAGFSAEAVAFGMGGGLLQKVNRDTMSFATKLSHIVYADGSQRDIMKAPSSDTSKTSLPGELSVVLCDGVPTVYPAEDAPVDGHGDLLEVIYDCGPVEVKHKKFDDIKADIAARWSALPPAAEVISAPLRRKIAANMAAMEKCQVTQNRSSPRQAAQ